MTAYPTSHPLPAGLLCAGLLRAGLLRAGLLRFAAGLLLVLVAAFTEPQPLQAQSTHPEEAGSGERILSFDSNIKIRGDGKLDILDRITVRAEGREIRRGIYRDFGTVLVQRDGTLDKVSYDFKKITRDGAPEKFEIKYFPGTIRVFLGDAGTLLTAGIHEYEIRYRVDRQIQFQPEQDVLTWNALGNFWSFPIEDVTVTLRLPKRGRLKSVDFFAGTQGEDSAAETLQIAADRNMAVFRREQVLLPGEGVTLRAELNKGVVEAPGLRQQLKWYLRDRLEAVGALLILVLVTAYYLAAWLRVGRDPPDGIIVPQWTPPAGISPALASYIQNRGFGSDPFRALSAAFISLAVKGFVTISGFDKTPTVSRTAKPRDDSAIGKLPAGEAAVLGSLDAHSTLQFSRANGKIVKALVSRFRSAIEREHGAAFFRLNRLYCVAGIALSLAGVAVLLVLSRGSLASLIPLLLINAVFLAVITLVALRLVKAFTTRTSGWRLIVSAVPLLIMAVVAAVATPALIAGFEIENPFVLVAFSALAGVNALFFRLMQAPTPLGQQVLTAIEGLQTYLKLAEQDRMNLEGAPDMSPQHFETLLPYAIALELEKPWSRAFDRWLATATAEQVASARSAGWHSHTGRGPGHLGRDLGRLSRSLEDDMRSAIPPPRSPSGSGGHSSGGFAGGGGGNIGGGGW
uniref:DUF2207 domain-containing protein n=1 Tax=Pararhizobium sp. IMCC3301 TaxID=3067904 RepID=UPI0027420B25|nr:DUF2207 domain-containing protein [Pararhizobium sp. IMCC3301]